MAGVITVAAAALVGAIGFSATGIGWHGMRERRDPSADVARALDGFHDAAAKADLERYFGHMTPEGVFLGTDATERWQGRQFREFCRPYFEKGKGWTYRPRDRHVELGPGGTTAWFDELLDNDSYGTCRGSGVLVLGGDGIWRIAQYNLSMPIPNDLAKPVVKMIREHSAQPPAGGG
jgi:ketosteroid isomerase-like protein